MQVVWIAAPIFNLVRVLIKEEAIWVFGGVRWRGGSKQDDKTNNQERVQISMINQNQATRKQTKKNSTPCWKKKGRGRPR
jgi:hypothetical protein